MTNLNENMLDVIVQLKLDNKKLEIFDISKMIDYNRLAFKGDMFRAYDGYCCGYHITALATDTNVPPSRTASRYLEEYNRVASTKKYVAGFSIGMLKRIDA